MGTLRFCTIFGVQRHLRPQALRQGSPNKRSFRPPRQLPPRQRSSRLEARFGNRSRAAPRCRLGSILAKAGAGASPQFCRIPETARETNPPPPSLPLPPHPQKPQETSQIPLSRDWEGAVGGGFLLNTTLITTTTQTPRTHGSKRLGPPASADMYISPRTFLDASNVINISTQIYVP